MANIYQTDSPMNREQRNNINNTWQDILNRFANLQRQINILAGGEEVDELLQQMKDAMENANSAAENANIAMEQIVSDFNNQMEQLEQAINNAVSATTEANNAAQSANDTVVEATELLKELKQLQDELKQLQITMTELAEDAKYATQNAKDAATNADIATADSKKATENAKTATDNAENATKEAQDAADAIHGWGSANEWTSGTYNKNNVVTRNGNTYQARKDNVTSTPPDPAVTNDDWMVLAKRGVDGTGAVSTVNGKSPDDNGNVEVELKWDSIENKPTTFTPSAHTHEISEIEGLQKTLDDKASDSDLNDLQQSVTDNQQIVADLQQTQQIVDTKVDKHINDDIGHIRYFPSSGIDTISIKTTDIPMVDPEAARPVPKIGVAFRFIKVANNTGNAKIYILRPDNTKPTLEYPLLDGQGGQLTANTLVNGGIYTVAFNGTNFFLQGNGSGVKEVVPSLAIYDTPGVYAFTPPKGVSRILVRLWGAGGGGGSRYMPSYAGGSGGGGGAFVLGSLDIKPGETLTVVVGKGGDGGKSGYNAQDGGNSYIVFRGQTYLVAGGGGAGSLYAGLGAGGGGKYNQTGPQNITEPKDGVPYFQLPSTPGKAIVLVSYSGGDGGAGVTKHGNGGGSAANDGGGGMKGEYITPGIASMNYFYDRGGNGGDGSNANNGRPAQPPGFGGGGGAGSAEHSDDNHPNSIGSAGGNGMVQIHW